MAKEYIEREAAKSELLSWAVSLNHPEYLIKDDALHIIDSIPAADVVEQEQESKLLNGWISVQVGRRMLKENGVETMDLLHGGNVPNWDRMTTNINVIAGFDELAATTGSMVYKTTILDTEYDCFNELIRYNDIVFAHSARDKKGE